MNISKQSVKIGVLLISLGAFLYAPLAYASPTINEFNMPNGSLTPLSITNGPDGNLWFCDSGTNSVGKMTTSGSVTEYTIPTSSAGCTDITSGPDGNIWFTEQTVNKIGKVTPSGSFTEYTVPTSSSAPQSLTSGPDGNIWFTEALGNKIGKVTPSGSFTEYTVPTSNSGPYGITSDDGYLWFTEYNIIQLGKISTSGSITEIPVPAHDPDMTYITHDANGSLWFDESNVSGTNQQGQYVGEYKQDGTSNIYKISTSHPIQYIAYNPNGYIYVVDQAGLLYRFADGGQYVSYSIPAGYVLAGGITTGPDNNLWFTETGTGVNAIGQFTIPPVPVVNNQTVSLTINASASTNVLANVSGADPSTLTIITSPNHGSGSVSNSSIIYTPSTNFSGQDSLTYSVCTLIDSNTCSQATITYNVQAQSPDTGYGQKSGYDSSYILGFISFALMLSGYILARSKTNQN